MKKRKWLAISVCEKTGVMFKLGEERRLMSQEEISGSVESSNQLLLLDQLLKRCSLSIHNIDAVIVVRGPGSFSSVRIGCALANSLALALRIPVIGIKQNQWSNLEESLNFNLFNKRTFIPVFPIYSKPPNITFPDR